MPLTNEQTAQAMVANRTYADRLGWASYADAIDVAIAAPGVDYKGADFAQALATWQTSKAVSSDGILGPQTWAAMQRALAPPDSVTGVRPTDAPDVPDGYDQIVATYGDPRPYLSPDGTISDAKKDEWERNTLAKGTLPYPVPIDANNFKTTFYAHRKLISSFEAVFGEVARLGLKDQIKSFDGIYNFRPIRGTTARVSLHAFGAAIDINASTNPLGSSTGDMSPQIIEIFRHFGFFWGGDFHARPDPMHFQYATGY